MSHHIVLPEAFCAEMKELLSEEYPMYLQSFAEESHTAIRVNTNKITLEEWERINPFSKVRVSWTKKGFYYDAKTQKPAKHPYYYAGLYYIQEPSAMIPASLLPVEAGDKVLDLCAAPGGKATELGAKLKGSGLLVANDISVSRTMALAKNLQFAGITNAVVTAEAPKKLRQHFGSYFDKILIDAPCSGEGMFRREPRMIKDWEEKGPRYYQKIQKEILSEAYAMLKNGGKMVYSTCTFSVCEDEEVIQWFLDTYEDMKVCPVERKEGFLEGRPDMVRNGKEELKHCVRIFPHRAKGEGHFAVLLQKRSLSDEETDRKNQADRLLKDNAENAFSIQKEKRTKKSKKKTAVTSKEKKHEDGMPLDKAEQFLKQFSWISGERKIGNNKVSIYPEAQTVQNGLRVIYTGLPVLEWKHKILPSPQLALALRASEYAVTLNLAANDDRVIRYLKGETIEADREYQEDVLICVDGYGIGWAKGTGTKRLKNRYYAGWRYQ